MGMFGALSPDIIKQLLSKVPLGGTPPIYGGKGGEYEPSYGIPTPQPDMGSIAGSASHLARKPGLFGSGSPGRAALGGLLDSILTQTGGQAINTPWMLAQKQHQMGLEDEQRKRGEGLDDAIKLAAAKAQFREPSELEQKVTYLNGLKPGLGDTYAQMFAQGPPMAVDVANPDGSVMRQYMTRGPTGSPQPSAPQTSKSVGGKQYWLVNGEWYDNPEGH